MAKPIPEFVQHVLDTMRHTAPISAKGMFGGWGLYNANVMVGLIADDVVYLKVDAKSEPAFAAAGSTPFTYEGKGKAVQMSYWRVPEEALEAPGEMRPWLKLAIDAALRANAAKLAKAPKRPNVTPAGSKSRRG